MTAAAVAAKLGVSRSLVYKLASSGWIPAYRLPGAAIRFAAQDIEGALTSWRSTLTKPRDAGASTIKRLSASRPEKSSESELLDYFRQAGAKARRASTK
ncbi:MAG: helix-turn-helix domain-containing protein [Betaproteobacteria bacterium]|nr:helix-turn-helix domain-containing protein [Betaproteobacteria bacterium]